MNRIRLLIAAFVLLGLAVGAYVTWWFQPLIGQGDDALPASPAILTVTTSYPGAHAPVVAETVAAPIEQQVQGMEDVQWFASESRHDGTYSLQVAVRAGADLDAALMLLQNRVNLAVPMLPEAVQRQGVVIRKQNQRVLLVVVSSTDGKRDAVFLWNYAARLRDELARVPGVSSITPAGSAPELRVRLDLDKLNALHLTTVDVVVAVQSLRRPVKGGPVLTVAPGNDPAKVADAIVLVRDAQVVRLRDVGQVFTDGETPPILAQINGRSVAVLGIDVAPNVKPADVTAHVRERMEALQAAAPAGVALAAGFDASDHLRFEVDFGAFLSNPSRDDVAVTLARYAGDLRGADGVEEVLALAGAPFTPPGSGWLLVKLRPEVRANAAQLAPVLAKRSGERTALRLAPADGFPLVLAVRGPEAAERLRFCNALATRLFKEPSLRDVRIEPFAGPEQAAFFDVDREKAKAQGVALTDLLTTIETVRDARSALALPAAKVRNALGELVPLAAMVTERLEFVPGVIRRRDGQPVLEITGSFAEGTTAAAACALCAKHAAEVQEELALPAEYSVKWAGR